MTESDRLENAVKVTAAILTSNACAWAFDLGLSDTVLFPRDGHRLVGAVNGAFERQHHATLEACIAVVKRRHSNDWSANATLAELEALRKAPDVAQNGQEP